MFPQDCSLNPACFYWLCARVLILCSVLCILCVLTVVGIMWLCVKGGMCGSATFGSRSVGLWSDFTTETVWSRFDSWHPLLSSQHHGKLLHTHTHTQATRDRHTHHLHCQGSPLIYPCFCWAASHTYSWLTLKVNNNVQEQCLGFAIAGSVPEY